MSRKSSINHANGSDDSRTSPVVISAALGELRRAASDEITAVDLTQLIEEAVEIYRHRACERGVRLACCVLDDLDVLGIENEIRTRLGTILSAAIDAAVPGSRMECNAAVERNGVVVRLRFMRLLTRSDGNAWEINGGEIAARWPHVEV